MSTYIIDRAPDKYGNQQKNYIEQVNTIVTKTTETFHVAVESKKDLKELFHETLETLGTIRNRIAIEHRTENANLFGIRRDREPFPGCSILTGLGFPYHEYNERLLCIFKKYLSTMKRNPQGFQQTELIIKGDNCLGRAASMEFSVLPYDKTEKYTLPFTSTDYNRMCVFCSIQPSEIFDDESFDSLVQNIEAMQKLKQLSPEDYKHLKLCPPTREFINWFKKEKSDWFERAIYLYHGFNITYNREKMLNLEALISLPKQFVDNYDSMINLNEAKM